MNNWPDVVEYLAKTIRDANAMAEYYRSERDRLEEENAVLRKLLEVKENAENALEAAR